MREEADIATTTSPYQLVKIVERCKVTSRRRQETIAGENDEEGLCGDWT